MNSKEIIDNGEKGEEEDFVDFSNEYAHISNVKK